VWSRESDSCLAIDALSTTLPTLEVPPSCRIPALVQHWCREHKLRTSFISVIGGVGRANGSVRWAAWIRLDRPDDRCASIPLSVIETRAEDVVTRQLAQALRTTLDTSSASRWLGHNPYWPEMVQTWIARRCGNNRVSAVTAIRADARSIVATATLDGRDVFFTARPLPFYDAELCGLLNQQSPGSFPHTLAYDEARGWWLTADVCARDLKTAIEPNYATERLPRTMTGLVNVQRATANAVGVSRVAFTISLDAVKAGVTRALDASQGEVHWTDAARATLLLCVDSLWDRTGAHEVTNAWIHSDPSPDNVRVDEHDRVVFIDLDDPWYGPMLLMGALTIHALRRRCGWTTQEYAARSYPAWRDYVTACDMKPARHTLDDWLCLAQLVRLIRACDRAATEQAVLLFEESPRRSHAIARQLHGLLGVS
jgi:hypothetical protein